MPKLNEIRQGRDIGKKSYTSWFIYASCENCGASRWIPYDKKEGVIRNRNRCKVCSNANGAGYEQASTSKERHWRNDYGIVLKESEYNQMFNEQGGHCAICGKHQSELKKGLNVDHNHKTGRVRGLLCPTCNFFVGCIENKDEIVKHTKEYLKKFL